MSVKEWLERNKSKIQDPDKLMAACRRETGRHRDTIRKLAAEIGIRNNPGQKSPAPAPIEAEPPRRVRQVKKTLADFRMQYDKSTIVPGKIRAGIERYLTGGHWETDINFRELCGVPAHLWHRYRDEFEQYQVRVDGKIIWADLSIVEEMKEVIAR